MKTNKKGFTLIELLIVIGILAVLSTATVLMLNPAQMLSESRDTQRLNDLSTLSTAISLLQATNTCSGDPNSGLAGGTTSACPATADATFNCAGTIWGASIAGATSSFGAGFITLAHAGLRGTDGTGWVAANLSHIPGGAPVSTLPIDPSNKTGDATSGTGTSGYNYQYACNANGRFEIDANLESAKYTTGTSNKEVNTYDGGSNAAIYETGSVVSL